MCYNDYHSSATFEAIEIASRDNETLKPGT